MPEPYKTNKNTDIDTYIIQNNRLEQQMFGQVLDMKTSPNIKSPLGSVMCSGRKSTGKADINVG